MTKQEERDFILRLLRQGGAGPAEKETIFQIYKKYIDPNHLTWVDSACSSCSSSIQRIWAATKDYILGENFIIDNENKKK